MTDLEYETARNKLIPTAERYADEKKGKRPAYLSSRPAWAESWTLCFLGKMDELAKEAGLI